MRFLLDMGLAGSTTAHLRALGHDALHLREQGLQRLSDEEIVGKAVAEGRVILTHDLDFGRIVALSGSRVPSVVTFRLANMRPEVVNHYLGKVIPRFSTQLEAGALVSVSEGGVRLRSLPINQ